MDVGQQVEDLESLIKSEGLEGLIGETHRLILSSLEKGNKTATEVLREIEGKHYITSYWQVVRALLQLKRIRCVREVGRRRTETTTAGIEPIYAITANGRHLLKTLEKRRSRSRS
ncbi:hypothetical protein CW700_03140 [Candidatus Bathyarchaeota archaeon]|nr:MAG: hypothetical protein CW700_03140 [Candidatus Bathyarchaeota archaeon]